MPSPLLTERDIAQIKSRGIQLEKVLSEIERFRQGFRFADLSRPATVGDGIIALADSDARRLALRYEAVQMGGRAIKFVPASGSATRMFQSLLEVLNSGGGEIELLRIREDAERGNSRSAEFLKFVSSLERFAFYGDLRSALASAGLSLDSAVRQGRYRAVLDCLFGAGGLGYASLPKGLIKFHSYPGGISRTAFEEHLAEAAEYIRDINGVARVHFTVPSEYERRIAEFFAEVQSQYKKRGITFDITLSVQDPSTDTVAVDLDNRPFRDSLGALVFRPAGHGALLRNLGNLGGDFIYIKNVDNVALERFAREHSIYKKALAGYLSQMQGEIFHLIRRLLAGGAGEGDIAAAFDYLRARLSLIPPRGIEAASKGERVEFLISKLNRPVRVCGMVKNEGEPGGGPFWTRGADGGESLQIVEASQVDVESQNQRRVWSSSTHFNPVDIVCGVRDYSGANFDLSRYSDLDSGFISIKSKDGRPLKALELPGLWNGSMANWITVFVEAPVSTFNPVKTVLDLLRAEHQAVS
ncbi:MAG: DUF4301 family protein [Deltaproteobacteria bacterium]